LLKQNYAISVRHLFAKTEPYRGTVYGSKIWVFRDGTDHPIEAELVAISEGAIFKDDYAVIRLLEDLGLPGLKIAHKEPKKGEKCIYTGSVGGLAFFSRFGVVSNFKWFFKRDDDDRLHLSYWEDYHYIMLINGSNGDSGGSVKNIKGEIITIMYCGLTVNGIPVIFGNPLSMLWGFLKENNLKWIAR